MSYGKFIMFYMLASVFAAALFFSAPPTMPATFYGVITATTATSSAPLAGQTLTATLNGSTETAIVGDTLLYSCGGSTCNYYITIERVSGDSSSTTVTFTINGNTVDTATFSEGAVVRNDFTVTTTLACLNNCGGGSGGSSGGTSGGTSGGGGGGSLTNETESGGQQSNQTDESGTETVRADISQPKSGVTGFEAVISSSGSSGSSLTLFTKILGESPLGVSNVPEIEVYKYVQLKLSDDAENVLSSKIQVRISSQWMQDNGVDLLNVRAFGYDGSKWVEEDLKFTNKDGDDYVFEVSTEGTIPQYLAFGGSAVAAKPVEVKTCLTEGCPSGFTCKEVSGKFGCVEDKLPVQQPVEQVTVPEAPKPDNTLLYLGGAAVVVILAVGGWYVLKK